MTQDELRRYYAWLAERDRQIIETRKAGLSYPAIARAFDVAPGTVRQIVRDAPVRSKRLTRFNTL